MLGVLFFLAIICGLSHRAVAQQGAPASGDLAWHVIDINGDARARATGTPIGAWHPLKLGDAVEPSTEISTDEGRAVLAYEDSRITIAAHSNLELPGHTASDAVYRVVERMGTILYKIVHETKDKFEVHTPYLTTVIKGTVFTVNVSDAGGAVEVAQGAVLVQPLSGNGEVVRPGQTARVVPQSPNRVEIQRAPTAPTPNNGDQRGSAAPDRPTPATEIANSSGTRSARRANIVFESIAPGNSDRPVPLGELKAGTNGVAKGSAGGQPLGVGTSDIATVNLGASGNGNGNGLGLGSGNGNANAGGSGNGPGLGGGNSNAGGNGSGLGLGSGNANAGGSGNGLGLGGGSSNAGGSGSGLGLGSGNANAGGSGNSPGLGGGSSNAGGTGNGLGLGGGNSNAGGNGNGNANAGGNGKK